MAIGPVVTRGFGSFGTVNLVVTAGYSAGAVVVSGALATGRYLRVPGDEDVLTRIPASEQVYLRQAESEQVLRRLEDGA